MNLDAAARRALRIRLLIGPLLLLFVVAVFAADRLWTRGRCSAAVLGLLSLFGLLEYVALLRGAGFPVGRRNLLAAAAVLHAAAFFYASWNSLDDELYAPILVTVVLVFGLAVRALARSHMHQGLEEMGATLLGFVLIAWPMYFAQGLALRQLGALLYVVLVAKFGDIGAYFTGVLLGRRKLLPHVSPGKSLEGASGSLLASCATALLCGGLLAPELQAGTALRLAFGVLINLTAQFGDLVESLVKRRCGAKDSSRLLPVHGGVLDLVDSLLFTVPAFFFVLVRLT